MVDPITGIMAVEAIMSISAMVSALAEKLSQTEQPTYEEILEDINKIRALLMSSGNQTVNISGSADNNLIAQSKGGPATAQVTFNPIVNRESQLLLIPLEKGLYEEMLANIAKRLENGTVIMHYPDSTKTE